MAKKPAFASKVLRRSKSIVEIGGPCSLIVMLIVLITTGIVPRHWVLVPVLITGGIYLTVSGILEIVVAQTGNFDDDGDFPRIHEYEIMMNDGQYYMFLGAAALIAPVLYSLYSGRWLTLTGEIVGAAIGVLTLVTCWVLSEILNFKESDGT